MLAHLKMSLTKLGCRNLGIGANAFRPADPPNGPESGFFFSYPTIIWEKGNLGAPGSACPLLLLGEMPEVEPPFRPPGSRKTGETARFGPPAGKTESTAATAPKFRSFYPLESSELMKNGPLRPLFRQKSVFTRRRVRVGGAGGTKVPFRCNSLRRSAPAG